MSAMKIPPSLRQMPKFLLSALVYSLPTGNNSTLQEGSMFPFLVLRGGAHSKVNSPSSGSNQDDPGPDLKVHGERLPQHCWEVLSVNEASFDKRRR